ncbi:MAG: hypothetical protein C0504_03050 [Candidatus Solibacter sp.]|nr:hypothetical protein [Candidatus Solibacter sp.]
MRKTTPPGAVISGRLADSILTRLPVLARNLGPVAAGSKRLASRYANTLRAGWAAGDWSELAQARLILLQVPACELDSALARLNGAIGSWDNRILVLLDDDLDCRALGLATSAGACAASLAHLRTGESGLAFVEGRAAAVSRLKGILARGGVRMIHLQPGDKAIFSAGINLGRLVSCALMDTVVRCLRKAGIDAATSRKIAGWIADQSVAEVLTRGKTGAVARRPPIPMLEPAWMQALCARDTRIERFSRQLMEAAAEYLGDEPDCRDALAPPGPGPRGRGKAAGL